MAFGTNLRAMPLLLMLLVSSRAVVAQPLERLTMLMDPVPGLISGGLKGEPPSGPAIDLLRRVGQESGIEFQVVIAPTARGQLDTNSIESACTAGIARTPARESLFKWAGPTTRARLVLLARADDHRRVRGAEDLKGLTIGAARGTVPAEWLADHQLNASLVQDPATSLRMLMAGRIDYWAVNEVVSGFVIRQSGITPPPQAVFTLGHADTYIACNRQVPDATVTKIDQAVDRMRRNGELAFVGLKRE